MQPQAKILMAGKLSKLFVLGLSLYSGLGSAAQVDGADQPPNVATLSYGLESSLTYVDVLQGVRLTGAAGDSRLLDSNLVTYPRTLGLSRLRAILDWQTPHGVSLRLTLRPDALTRRDESGADFVPREFDARSGDSGMKPLPSIRFLDAYQMNLPIATNLVSSVGVFESFRSSKLAYQPVLGFGLDVILPAKFSGLMLDWQSTSTAIATAAEPNPSRVPSAFAAQLYYLLGDQDRGELIGGHGGSYDLGPSAKDPYQGGALSVAWRPGTIVEVTGLGGYLRTSELGGAYDSVFAQIAMLASFDAWNQRHRLSFDGRFEKDHGRDGVSPQNLLSGALNFAWGVGPDADVLLGVRAGRSSRWTAFVNQRSKTVSLRGYQVEAGYQAVVDRSLSLAVLASREFRVMNADAQELGGFQDTDGSKSMIHRVGLEVSYHLNSNG